jgi:ADP-ribosylglycohydrolase
VSLRYECSLEDCIKFAKISGNITHKHKDNANAINTYMLAAYSSIIGDVYKFSGVNNISELGEGWIAPECVNMAIWAYSEANTFDELLALSIAHDGDSDSVAAVAGSLWGLSGREVPQKYIDKLDALDAIKYIEEQYLSRYL